MIQRFVLVPLDFFILEVPTDVQASLLSYVGQQAIAHAAAIFATLTAAFTFATFQKNLHGNRTTFCVLILSVLLAGGIYAGLRLYYYGLLSGIVLNSHAASNQTLAQYWNNVTLGMSSGGSSTIFYLNLGFGQTIQSICFSFVVGFAVAVGVASFSIENQNKGWWDTFHVLPWWLKVIVYWAGFDYFFEITLVRVLLYVLPQVFTISKSTYDWQAVLIALVSSLLVAVILYKWHKWVNRLIARMIRYYYGRRMQERKL